MNKNVERGQATRAHLVDVATQLFAAHGYDGTSIEVALKIARADDPAATLPDAESAFAEFLDRLLDSPADARGE